MNRFFLSLTLLCSTLIAAAQTITVSDTIALTVTSIAPEPDPNNQEYIFAIFGDANSQSYKINLDYHSASMYGVFSDTDFDLAGSGKNYNFIRTSDGMKFWLFQHLDVTVSDSQGATIIEVNGLINDMGSWRRVLATAIIPAPAPEDTIALDLGLVTVIPMNQFGGYGYLRLDAANDDYSLAFGLVGINALRADTFYRADMLRPDLVLLPEDTIPVTDATLVITDIEDGYHALSLTLLSETNILYQVQMHTGLVEAIDTVEIVCSNGLIQNITEMYGIYQLAGVSPDYQVAIGLTPGVIEQSQLTFTSDSVNLAYTRILDVAANEMIYIQQASGRFEPDSTAFLPRMMVYADLLGINRTLYQVRFPVGGSQLPMAEDTTYIDCGNRIGRLDYTQGAGMLGLVIGDESADVHVTFYNGLRMEGSFGTDMFDYEQSYVTNYRGELYSFDDITGAEMRMDSIGDTVHIALNVVTYNSHMYCFTANLLPMRALTGDSVVYHINDPLLQDGMLVSYLLAQQGDAKVFQVQMQRADEWDEEMGEPVGENNEVWNFAFMQDSVDGISGRYSISDGTLLEDDNLYHMLRERNTEIWLRPMAQTLRIEAGEELIIPDAATGLGFDYHTHFYSILARIVAENGMLYHVEGQNFLLCVDPENGQYIELTERALTAINSALQERGLRVRKVLRDGLILLETTEGNNHSAYDLQGRKR